MGFWPLISNPIDPLITITPTHKLSLGGNNGDVALVNAPWTGAINRAIFIPFRLPKTIIVQNMFVINGATIAGSFDLGIYTLDGTKLVSTGLTAQTGASVVQSIAITPAQLGPGLFYMAIVSNSLTSTFLQQDFVSIAFLKAMGLAQMSAALPLPATVTFATISVAIRIPLVGLTARAFV